MRSIRIGALSLAMLGVACDHNLDEIDGHVLGKPESVVFARNQSGHIMFVMSDLPNLCDALASADPPAMDEYWVMSSWTRVDVDAPGDFAAEAYIAVAQNPATDEYETESGSINVQRLGVEVIKGKLDLTFPGVERIKAHFTAELCDEDLFVGMY